MSPFIKSMIFTAVPLVVLAFLGVITNHISSGTFYSYVWIAAGVYFVGAFVAGVIFAILGKLKTTAGIFTGMAIGAVAMGASCFALIFSSGL